VLAQVEDDECGSGPSQAPTKKDGVLSMSSPVGKIPDLLPSTAGSSTSAAHLASSANRAISLPRTGSALLSTPDADVDPSAYKSPAKGACPVRDHTRQHLAGCGRRTSVLGRLRVPVDDALLHRHRHCRRGHAVPPALAAGHVRVRSRAAVTDSGVAQPRSGDDGMFDVMLRVRGPGVVDSPFHRARASRPCFRLSNKATKDMRAREPPCGHAACICGRGCDARPDTPAAGPHGARRHGRSTGGGHGPRCGLEREKGPEPGVVDGDAEPGDVEGDDVIRVGVAFCFWSRRMLRLCIATLSYVLCH
jgi:hypothetical protein